MNRFEQVKLSAIKIYHLQNQFCVHTFHAWKVNFDVKSMNTIVVKVFIQISHKLERIE